VRQPVPQNQYVCPACSALPALVGGVTVMPQTGSTAVEAGIVGVTTSVFSILVVSVAT
jgi:hypothetical protein